MKQHKGQEAGRKAKKIAVFLAQIVLMIWLFESLGWLGFGLSILMFGALIIWRKWGQFILVKQQIETMIWGKPLNFFTKDELKRVRYKVSWDKKKSQ
jgi:hypothetical protein